MLWKEIHETFSNYFWGIGQYGGGEEREEMSHFTSFTLDSLTVTSMLFFHNEKNKNKKVNQI